MRMRIEHRRILEEIFRAGLRAVEPKTMIHNHVKRKGSHLT